MDIDLLNPDAREACPRGDDGRYLVLKGLTDKAAFPLRSLLFLVLDSMVSRRKGVLAWPLGHKSLILQEKSKHKLKRMIQSPNSHSADTF